LTRRQPLPFEAAVTRPLSVVFKAGETWEGHDYTVEVVAARQGLDGFDVVMDFRDLEAALDRSLAPLQGRLLSDLGLDGPLALAQRLVAELAPFVPEPARLKEVALTDGRGRRLAVGL
jgi:6-pyruvoyl-tetrahydropterin synthase